MKKLSVTFYFLLLCSFALTAQKTFDLELNGQVKDSSLVLDLYIKKSVGEDFALGASNFDFTVKSSGLNLADAKFLPGEFDVKKDPNSYQQMGIGNNQFLAMNIRPNVQGSGTGRLVTDVKTKIGSVEIPITNPCASVSPEWVVGGAAIHRYFKTTRGKEITKDANYLTPTPIELDGGLSKTIPTITMSKGKLISSSATNNQWYLDGTPIPGANLQEMTPLLQGKYSVEVAYPCAKNISEAVPIVITGLADFSVSYGYAAQPNPFIGESTIVYSLPNSSSIKLELYDLGGTHILDLESGLKSQGKHEFVFKPNFYNLSAGSYVVKLTVGDKMGTMKLVALK